MEPKDTVTAPRPRSLRPLASRVSLAAAIESYRRHLPSPQRHRWHGCALQDQLRAFEQVLREEHILALVKAREGQGFAERR